jgi:hypothetical protein
MTAKRVTLSAMTYMDMAMPMPMPGFMLLPRVASCSGLRKERP